MKQEQKKQVAGITILITGIFMIFIGFAYAFLNQNLLGTKRQVITTGNLEVNFKETNQISLNNALPMYDEVGILQEPFLFEVKNNETLPLDYRIKLTKIPMENEISLANVKYQLVKNNESTIGLISNIENDVIDSGSIGSGQIIEYQLRMWIKNEVEDESEIYGKSLSFRVDVEVDKQPTDLKVVEFDTDDADMVPYFKKVIIGTPYGELPTPTKTGHTFLGWYNEKEQLVTKDTIATEEDGTIKAKWEPNKYQVTLIIDDPNIADTTREVTYGSTYEGLPWPFDGQHEFLGWFTEKDGGTEVELNSKVTVANDHTLYAHWKYYTIRNKFLRKINCTINTHIPGYNVGNSNTAILYECEQNYVSYSGHLWRIVSMDKDNDSIKMVSEKVLRIHPTIYVQGATIFGGTSIDEWLNQDFLATLEEPDKYLVMDSMWYDRDYDSQHTRPTPENYPMNSFSRAVGMLSFDDYKLTVEPYSNKTYLKNGETWGLITREGGGWYITIDDNGANYNALPYTNVGIRPSIYIKPSVRVSSGAGTKDSPFILTVEE